MFDEAGTFAKNGLIRKLTGDQQWQAASFSENGSFLAALSTVQDSNESEIQVLETFVPKSSLQIITRQVNNGFVWSKHKRESTTSLLKVENTEHLVLLDNDYHLLIYAVKPSSERGDGVKSPKSSCIQSISNSFFTRNQIEDNGKTKGHVLLLSACYDDLLKKHRIICIVEKSELLVIEFKDGCDVCIEKQIQLPETSCKDFSFKQFDSVVVGVSFSSRSFILDLEEGKVIQYFNINSSPCDFAAPGNEETDFVQAEISENLKYIITVDKSGKLYIINMHIDDLLTKERDSENLPHKSSRPKADIQANSATVDLQWRKELTSFQYEMLDEGFLCKDEASHRYPQESDTYNYVPVEELQFQKLDVPPWTLDYDVKSLLPCESSLIVHLIKPSTKQLDSTQNEADATGDTDVEKISQNLLLLFDLQTQKSSIQRIPDNAIVARSTSNFFPHCIFSSDMLYLPTFNTSQEQLFSGFIQYSGISEAEKICRSNQWNQFSVPLHSLEVGLQHRQIDTISFFLKSRDKAFSKYWRSMSLPETASALPSSYAESNSVDDISSMSSPSSSSLSSFSSSLAKPTIDPIELHKAVDMLVKAIHQNSKGQHKKNFFEALLRMCIDFLNNLIRDAVDVLETIDRHSLPMQVCHQDGAAKHFTFIVDIPESTSYLVECLKGTRQFISDLPSFYNRKEDLKSPVAAIVKSPISLKDYVEEEISAGRLSRLQEYVLKNSDRFAFKEVLDGSLASLIKFGFNFSFRMLLEKDMKKSMEILKNLGKNDKEMLKIIFEYTLDRRLRQYLITELTNEGMMDIFNHQDKNDIAFMGKVEMLYPCSTVEDVCKWRSWLTSTDSQLASQITCSSLRKRSKEDTITEGNYSELMFKWIQQWDSASKDNVLLDAIFVNKKTENLRKLVSSEILWNYFVSHNYEKEILNWTQTLVYQEAKKQHSHLPVFDPNLMNNCSNAASFLNRKIIYEFVKLGIYTDDMVEDFPSILKVISEASTLFGKPDTFVRNVALKSKLHLKFIEYFLKNDLREVMFLYLDHHNLHPSLADFKDMGLTLSDFPWFSFILLLRNLSESGTGCDGLSLRNAAAVFQQQNDGSLLTQFCKEKPLIVLASILLSPLKMSEVISAGSSNPEFPVDVSSLKTSMLSLDETLYSAVFGYLGMHEQKPTTMYDLLQNNTHLNAQSFFNWQPTNKSNADAYSSAFELPSFSSPDLVQKYGLVVNVKYTYYLKQSRPVYAYLAFVSDTSRTIHGKDKRRNSAYKHAYWIAVNNFNSDSIVCSCAAFIDLLEMNSWPLRVDIECANYIVKNWKHVKDRNRSLPRDENLNSLIVSCLKRKKKGKRELLQMLEESVESTVFRENIERTSFDAMIFWRIPMQFAKLNKLSPPLTYVKECAENGVWYHAIVFIQIYQLEPSQVLSCLEHHLHNSILREHLLAVIKNTKPVTSSGGTAEKKINDQKASKKSKKTKKTAEKDFRAQFYYSLKRGMKEKQGDDGERRLTAPSARVQKPQSSSEQEKSSGETADQKEETADNIDNSSTSGARNGGKIDAFQMTNDVIDIILECEESGYPCRELLSFAFSLSQPFFVVLAACYQSSDRIDCLCAWLILNFKEERRLGVFSKFNDVKEEKYQLGIESLFVIISDLISSEDDAPKIIAQGFRIFLEESCLLHFFWFYEAFTSREDFDTCIRHMTAFALKLKEEIENEKEASLIRSFFARQIPIKILLRFRHSKLYQRKLLQFYIDAGFDAFQTFTNYSLEGLRVVCIATQNANIAADFSKLTCDDEEVNDAEQDRLYDALLDNGCFEEATRFAASFNLPVWKVHLYKINSELEKMKYSNLWQNEETRLNFWFKADDLFTMHDVCSSVAGSFFHKQSEDLVNLPCGERAFLLSMAFRWFKYDNDGTVEHEKETFLYRLEKQIWIYKIKAEIERNSQEDSEVDCRPPSESSSRTLTTSSSYSSSHLFTGHERTSSMLSMKHSTGNCELLQPDEIDFTQTDEASSSPLNETECKAFDSLVGDLLVNCEITEARRVSAFFGRNVEDLNNVLNCIFLAQGTKRVDGLDADTASVIARSYGRSLSVSGTYDMCTPLNRSVGLVDSVNSSGRVTNDWVVIAEPQIAIEKLCSKCEKGRNCCERVLVCYQIAVVLGIEYSEAVQKEPFTLLRELIFCGMDTRRKLCRQFIKAFELPTTEVAGFIAQIIILWLRISTNSTNSVDGFDLIDYSSHERTTFTAYEPTIMVENTFTSEDMSNFIQLVDQPSDLGSRLLEEAKPISHLEDTEKNINKLQYQTELIIRAHDCFTLACNMEGIADVLRAARLCVMDLVNAKAYSLMVRILTGIGRFKEMTYVFEALAEQHHFELLFSKNIEKEKELKAALLDFIKNNNTDDKDKMEKIDMLSNRFGMYREVGEQLEETGHKQISSIKDKLQGNMKGIDHALMEIAKTFSYAAGYYLKVDCLQRSRQCKKLARLAELQMRLSASGKRVLGLDKNKVNQFLCSHADFYEALVIADAYGLTSSTTWVDPLYQICIVKGDTSYLKQYLSVLQLSPTVMTSIAARYRSDSVSSQMCENLRKMLSNVKEIKLRYKVAREFNLNDVKGLLKGASGAYLRDTEFISEAGK